MSQPMERKMNIKEFFKAKEDNLQPIFITKKDVKVASFVWICGFDPYQEKKTITIPAGTRLVINGYSNFGSGHSMSFEKRPKLGKNSGARWFKINYSNLKLA